MAIDPMTILAATQAAMGIGQMVKGAIGSSKDAPTMEIPKSATQALGIAKTQAGAREMPGQKIMEDKLASQAGAAANKMMQMSGGSGAALGGVAQVQQNLNDAMGNMQVQQAGFVAGRQDALRGELGNMAQWENQQFQMNEFQPYLQRMQASAQLKDAGMKNLWGSASEFVKGQQTKDMWDQYIGLQQGKIDADREASGALFNMGKKGSGGGATGMMDGGPSIGGANQPITPPLGGNSVNLQQSNAPYAGYDPRLANTGAIQFTPHQSSIGLDTPWFMQPQQQRDPFRAFQQYPLRGGGVPMFNPNPGKITL